MTVFTCSREKKSFSRELLEKVPAPARQGKRSSSSSKATGTASIWGARPPPGQTTTAAQISRRISRARPVCSVDDQGYCELAEVRACQRPASLELQAHHLLDVSAAGHDEGEVAEPVRGSAKTIRMSPPDYPGYAQLPSLRPSTIRQASPGANRWSREIHWLESAPRASKLGSAGAHGGRAAGCHPGREAHPDPQRSGFAIWHRIGARESRDRAHVAHCRSILLLVPFAQAGLAAEPDTHIVVHGRPQGPWPGRPPRGTKRDLRVLEKAFKEAPNIPKVRTSFYRQGASLRRPSPTRT